MKRKELVSGILLSIVLIALLIFNFAPNSMTEGTLEKIGDIIGITQKTYKIDFSEICIYVPPQWIHTVGENDLFILNEQEDISIDIRYKEDAALYIEHLEKIMDGESVVYQIDCKKAEGIQWDGSIPGSETERIALAIEPDIIIEVDINIDGDINRKKEIVASFLNSQIKCRK